MKVNGVDINDLEYLKELIKSHYGSIRTFCLDVWIPYRKTLNMFNKLDFSLEYYEKVKDKYYKSTKTPMESFGRISNEEREAIRICIAINFKTASNFCSKYDSYDGVYISNIVNGRLKRRTVKFVGLLNTLDKKYKLKLNK
jgi:hypothetical protein